MSQATEQEPRQGLGRARGRLRCPACLMHETLCLCEALPRLSTETRVEVWQHALELERPTNTGRLLALILPSCRLRPFGGPRGAPPEVELDPERRTYLLFPAPDAVVLTAELAHQDPRPLTLVVPDGTWTQAKRGVRTLQAGLPALRLPDGRPTQFALRSPRRDLDRLSTLEAVARALGIIEGHPVEAALLAAQRLMVERTLFTRGELSAAEVTGGLDARGHAHALSAGRQSRMPASRLAKNNG